MKPLRLSAQLLARRLGWPGALLALLVGGAIGVQLNLLPAERAKSADLSHRITALKQAPAAPADTAASTNRERLQIFNALMPPASRYPAVLQLLFDLAASHNLVIAQAEYTSQPSDEGGYVTCDIALPLKGPYPQIRAFIGDALLRLPTLALLGVEFRRDDARAADVQASLRLRLYLRRDT
ncbi:hypothetical protein B7R78_0019845 [Ralstonia solanacearum]|uniref:Pilus assembly protein PilO n=1 Tax=Ralstonia solanacearum K60 TaxID=1091042 RepID=A0AAP7ZHB2_RALSL|nr:hypothetical protein [Ralstonia solanacearum]MBT1539261.1 hypothetical protein [Ralstonia solanacearum]OYQ09030.1 hypothetical protein B7R77_18710 [Ralstonia solanacearum K60]RIJ85109.1 hypothetical protein RSP822_17595 [Ralstonia solanacearum]